MLHLLIEQAQEIQKLEAEVERLEAQLISQRGTNAAIEKNLGWHKRQAKAEVLREVLAIYRGGGRHNLTSRLKTCAEICEDKLKQLEAE